MHVEIIKQDNTDVLQIQIPMTPPTPSASGKTLTVASSRGNQKTNVKVNGKEVTIGLNAYIYR